MDALFPFNCALCRIVEFGCTISRMCALPPKLAGKRCTYRRNPRWERVSQSPGAQRGRRGPAENKKTVALLHSLLLCVRLNGTALSPLRAHVAWNLGGSQTRFIVSAHRRASAATRRRGRWPASRRRAAWRITTDSPRPTSRLGGVSRGLCSSEGIGHHRLPLITANTLAFVTKL